MKRANPRKRICPIEKTISHEIFRDVKRAFYCSTHKFSVLDLRSPYNTGHLLLLFFFQFSFFFWIKLGLFLLFPFAFVFFPLITHICFSLFESDYTDLEILTIVVLSVLKFHRLSYQKTKYHPSTDTLRVSHEKRTAKILCYLASIWTIRLFNRCCDICKDFRLEILAIYSRYQQFSSKNWDGWYHRFFEPLILVDKLE